MKTFLEYLEEKTVNVVQRKKLARRMAKMQGRLHFKQRKNVWLLK